MSPVPELPSGRVDAGSGDGRRALTQAGDLCIQPLALGGVPRGLSGRVLGLAECGALRLLVPTPLSRGLSLSSARAASNVVRAADAVRPAVSAWSRDPAEIRFEALEIRRQPGVLGPPLERAIRGTERDPRVVDDC